MGGSRPKRAADDNSTTRNTHPQKRSRKRRANEREKQSPRVAVSLPAPGEGSNNWSISKNSINQLPLTAFNGTVAIVSSESEEGAALAPFEGHTVLGFDTETKPSFTKGEHHPVSVVQLSTHTHAVLFLLRPRGAVTPGLARLLADPNIHKVGQGVHSDARTLHGERGLTVRGVVNLQSITAGLAFQQSSLRALAAMLLGGRISKGQQKSDWARRPLNAGQVHYAATDAWVSLMVYEAILKLEGAKEFVLAEEFP
eukprot:TRINITY_DN6371_c0_g1_i2.p1 TRINITY_DN6371_c0_g1~~TRINITY_DN6371_c0_g1_i2.p1  ORF type:complete len:255 (+),score=52.70 TRINITY_DN6371_c0_g1_i2:69-833(+)